MPTVLSYLNVSNASNLLADSGFVFQEALLAGLRSAGWQTILIGPRGLASVSSGPCIEIDIPDSKYGVRFGFAWSQIDAALDDCGVEPDILLANQPEVAIPLSALLSGRLGRRIPLAVYFHYLAIDDPGKRSPITFDPSLDDDRLAECIWARQVESARRAEVVLIGSEWGRETFLTAAGDPDLAGKVSVVPPPRTVAMPPTRRPRDPKEVTFVYNHRLYAHYGTAELFDWLAELHATSSQPFRVLVTNPTARRSAARRRLDGSVDALVGRLRELPFVQVVDAGSRVEYEAVLRQADIGLSPLRPNALWNMSLVDAMTAGLPVLGYARGAIPEIIGDDELLFGGRAEFLERAGRLLRDPGLRLRLGRSLQLRTDRWSAGLVTDRVDALLTGALAAASESVATR